MSNTDAEATVSVGTRASSTNEGHRPHRIFIRVWRVREVGVVAPKMLCCIENFTELLFMLQYA